MAAHYMPYLSGLSQMELLQQYAVLAASTAVAPLANYRSGIHPLHSPITHSPLFSSFSRLSTIPATENVFAEAIVTDKIVEEG